MIFTASEKTVKENICKIMEAIEKLSKNDENITSSMIKEALPEKDMRRARTSVFHYLVIMVDKGLISWEKLTGERQVPRYVQIKIIKPDWRKELKG